jgi:hypothetical protein
MKQIHLIRTLSVLLVILFNSSILMAGTIVEIKNKDAMTTVLTDGKKARMNSGGDDYVIVDYASSSVKIVDTKKRQVMSLDVDDLPKGSAPQKIHTAVKNLGRGPVIAGYKTQKFNYTVNGQSCGVIYGSKDVYQLKGIKKLLDAMNTIAERQQSIMGGFAGMIDNCTLANMEMIDHVATTGVPMRTINKNKVDSEIQSIKLDVALPADTFTISASYKVVTMKEEMQGLEKDMAKVQQQMQQYQPQMQEMMRQHEPQMQEVMRQMQQSGQMSPEMMEQMRQAQEMMKQYQQ